MPKFKKDPNAVNMHSPYKMKGSPMKRNFGIDDVVSSVGSKLQKISKAAGDFKAKRKQVVADKAKASSDGLTNFQRRQADRKAQRASGGKSKYQRNIEARKSKSARKTIEATKTKELKPGEFTTKQKLEGKLVPNQELVSKKVNKPESKLTFKKAFAAASKAGKKTFSWNGKSYTTELAKK